MHNMGTLSRGDPGKGALNRRLEDIGWGLLLILTGGILLVPDERVPQGFWLIGAGIILLGSNLVRYLNGIAVTWFSTIMGLFALPPWNHREMRRLFRIAHRRAQAGTGRSGRTSGQATPGEPLD